MDESQKVTRPLKSIDPRDGTIPPRAYNLLYVIANHVHYGSEQIAEFPIDVKYVRSLIGVGFSSDIIQLCLDQLEANGYFRKIRNIADSNENEEVVGVFIRGIDMEYVKAHYDQYLVKS